MAEMDAVGFMVSGMDNVLAGFVPCLLLAIMSRATLLLLHEALLTARTVMPSTIVPGLYIRLTKDD